MLAVRIEGHHSIVVLEGAEAGEQGVPLAAVSSERQHAGAELARHLGSSISRTVVHDQHVRRPGKAAQAEKDLAQMGGGLVGRH